MPSISAFGCFFDESVGVGVNLQAGEYPRHVQANDSLSWSSSAYLKRQPAMKNYKMPTHCIIEYILPR
jgi:hypothetical protein